ncbi:MAG: hypothetical protein EOP87_11175, partial [Verrucomicrobiaceae bacterium]
MKYRPSKWFSGIVLTGGLASLVLWFGILPDLEEVRVMSQPGEIVFPEVKASGGKGDKRAVAANFDGGNRAVMMGELLDEGWDNLMRWKFNPWRNRKGIYPGDHLRKLLASDDPADVAKGRDIQRRAEYWMRKLMERYPELAMKPHPVPDERNGFLKWVEFHDRFKNAMPGKVASFGFSEAFPNNLAEKTPWDPKAASEWMKANSAIMDEIRAMGLLPDASSDGIAVDRYGFIHARLAKECTDALMMEARLAAENGDVAAAMESVRAARGLSGHLGDVESASLLQTTVRILTQLDIEQRVFSEILPALPDGSRDPSAWEAVVRPEIRPPSDFARIMKGEWSVTLREWVLPPILDAEDTMSPPDPGALLDAYTRPFAELVQNAANLKPGEDLPSFCDAPQTAGLSRTSRQMMEMLFIGSRAWGRGHGRAVSSQGLTQAAFSVMKDGTVPV